jgi:ketosteroid isomerase-like protein
MPALGQARTFQDVDMTAIDPHQATNVRADRIALFGNLRSPATHPAFWDRVADDVDWTVEGTHPLAGRYHTKKQFVEATFVRIARLLPDGVKLEIEHLHVDGDTTIVELRSISTTKEGTEYANHYCWVCRFDGETIVEVRAYLDTMMVAYTILRNENRNALVAPWTTFNLTGD